MSARLNWEVFRQAVVKAIGTHGILLGGTSHIRPDTRLTSVKAWRLYGSNPIDFIDLTVIFNTALESCGAHLDEERYHRTRGELKMLCHRVRLFKRNVNEDATFGQVFAVISSAIGASYATAG